MAQGDLYLGYNSDMLYFGTPYDDFIIFNPRIYGEAALHGYVQLDFFWASIRLIMDFTGYRINIVEASTAVNINKWSQYCGGLSYSSEALATEFGA